MTEATIDEACRTCERHMTAGEVEPSMNAFVGMLATARASLDQARWRKAAQSLAQDPVHSLLLNDPYTASAYRKPRGYAGDADTLDFVYRCREAPPQTTPLGHRLFRITTDVPIACAVRARARYLADRIAGCLSANPQATIVSIACGHMRELEWIPSMSAREATIYGLDHDPATIARLERLHPFVLTKPMSVRQILRRPEAVPPADLIYASGLFDYLDDRTASLLIRRLRSRLAPNGLLIVTNLTALNKEIAYMEAIMDWWMVYRDERELLRLAAPAAGQAVCSLLDGRVACLETRG
jgi:extracellular factor (EF) 3-hydroxypalmitic acid methyl ester biosynthesis protein